MTRPCTYCGAPLNPEARETYTRITGWEKKPLAGSRRGGSDITLRERRDDYACERCIQALRSGITPQQGTFV